MGDSTCRAQSLSFLDLHGCEIKTNEQGTDQIPEAKYWSHDDRILNIETHVRDCSKCDAFRTHCHFGRFEYITKEYIQDTEITTRRNGWENSCLIHPWLGSLCSQSLTTQEFIFNEYLHICPDVIYHMSTGVHDIARYTPNQFKRNIDWFLALVNEFHQRCPNTQYYWSTSSHVAETLVPEQYKSITTNKVLYEYNQIYNTSIPTFAKHGFDQWAYTANLDLSIYGDAVHLKPDVYRAIAVNISTLIGLSIH